VTLTAVTAPTHAELRGVTKTFGHHRRTVTALDGVDLDVRRGEMLGLVGASGCGKSTILNLLAGLEQPTAGSISVDGHTGLMFQEAALFPWLTVAANVELPMRLRGVGRRERQMRAGELLDVVHLGAFAHARPHELSGGMRQRVALARTLAQDAELLLMDEPFGALDAMTRDALHDEIEAVHLRAGLTTVFVTHDVREAVRLADRVVVLASRPGRVAAIVDIALGRPRRIDDAAAAALAGEITEHLRSSA
jgi:NitT/TauT family transport system ATP-binding protein